MAYHIAAGREKVRLPYLPSDIVTKSGLLVTVDNYDAEKDEQQIFDIFKHIVEEGDTYPQDSMSTVEEFRAYYTTHETYVCRLRGTATVVGAFYIKPNFPGRSSHICNAGFIVHKDHRGQGIAKLMAQNYLQMARDLGYKASFFNLVFVHNTASLKIWRGLGFQETGRIPNAGNLKGRGYTDAVQFYYDLETIKKTEF